MTPEQEPQAAADTPTLPQQVDPEQEVAWAYLDGEYEGRAVKIRYPARFSLLPIDTPQYHPRNARQGDVGAIVDSIVVNGFLSEILVQASTGYTAAGNHRLQAARALKLEYIPGVQVPLDDEATLRFLLADNRTSDLATYDTSQLAELLIELSDSDLGLDGTGYDGDSLDDLLNSLKDATPDTGDEGDEGNNDPSEKGEKGPGDQNPERTGTLQNRFLIPPFSVLDTRQGYWRERKRAWLALGLKSELGRDVETFAPSAQSPAIYNLRNAMREEMGRDPTWDEILAEAKRRNMHVHAGVSIFDPVLTELSYLWFCPPGGTVLDPFAGGSVRGVVAAALGLQYVGVELRGEQVEANRNQWSELEPRLSGAAATTTLPETYTPDLTPVEQRGEYWFKRDDAFCVGGVRGGKVRTCYQLAQEAQAEGYKGLTTAGSRQSPQVNIVAHVGKHLGLPVRVHTPQGELSPEVRAAEDAGATVIQHKAGYNNVIIARAREDAEAMGYFEVPFGMEHPRAVEYTAAQVANLPAEVSRIVMPVGSGMSLAGVLTGLQRAGRNIPVVGVQVGADPTERLDKYAPKNWRDLVTLEKSALDYHDHAPVTQLAGVELDPVYEAKVLPFVQPGDLVWVVGIRQTRDPSVSKAAAALPTPAWVHGDSCDIPTLIPDVKADLVYSCPPYFDLEVYSDDPRDISNMDYDGFHRAYRQIIQNAVNQLKDDRFAVFVVNDVRNPKSGFYVNLLMDTIKAFEDAGAHFYNEIVLVNNIGSAAIRAGKQFAASRKVARTHQNVLVFFKGDTSTIRTNYPELQINDLESFAEPDDALATEAPEEGLADVGEAS